LVRACSHRKDLFQHWDGEAGERILARKRAIQDDASNRGFFEVASFLQFKRMREIVRNYHGL
jgi:hypothetical protein